MRQTFTLFQWKIQACQGGLQMFESVCSKGLSCFSQVQVFQVLRGIGALGMAGETDNAGCVWVPAPPHNVFQLDRKLGLG